MVAGVVALAFSPVGQALLRHVTGQRVSDEELAQLKDELADLRAELEEVRGGLGQVHELQERLDFAERLLAQQRAREALPGGS